MTVSALKKRVCVAIDVDIENSLTEAAVLSGTSKSKLTEAALREFFKQIGINDKMPIRELRNALISFFKQDIY